MPSVLTHYVFNKEVLDNNDISFVKGNEDVYLLGAQGPDPFFFYGLIPLTNNKNGKVIRKYGTSLHHIAPNEAFESFFDYANKSDNKDVLFSYILGAGLHYILDRNVHPYVFYKTGFSDDKKMKSKYFVDHTLFETNMDVLLLKDKYLKYKVRPATSIKCDKNKVRLISEMYYDANKKIINEEKLNEDSFYLSVKHMQTIEKCLYSKYGIKKSIVKVILKNTPLNTMMHPRVVKDDVSVDYLNIKKGEWKHPVTGIASNKSVYDLFESGKLESDRWISIVNKAYENKDVSKELLEFTKDIIYDGVSYGKKMKYFKNVYGKGEGNDNNVER